jgi:hypothetical protein
MRANGITSVVAACQSSESFLASSVPLHKEISSEILVVETYDLELDHLLLKLDGLDLLH